MNNTMALVDIEIRETAAEDFNDIMDVEKSAFGYDKEANLVSSLLADPSAEPVVSLLAFHEGKPVGHILFTRASFDGLDGRKDQPLMHILAPLAVIPGCQRQGIGGMLIKAGLELLKEKGSQIAFVLGHREYYTRYGFIP